MSYIFSSNSEADTSDLLENIEEKMFPQYYMHSENTTQKADIYVRFFTVSDKYVYQVVEIRSNMFLCKVLKD